MPVEDCFPVEDSCPDEDWLPLEEEGWPDWLELADSLCLPELEDGDGIDGLDEGIDGLELPLDELDEELLLEELDGGLLLGIEGADGSVCCDGDWHP